MTGKLDILKYIYNSLNHEICCKIKISNKWANSNLRDIAQYHKKNNLE